MPSLRQTMSSHSDPIETAFARLRVASAEDADCLAALYAEALPPGWPAPELAASCADPNRTILSATAGAKMHGFVIVQFAADEAEILAVAVAKDCRRQGCATSLVKAAIEACRGRFISCIYLEVAESNTGARELYEKFGFRAVARRENYYQSAGSSPDSALVMKLDAMLSGSSVDRERSRT